jgi:hypothetical protein
MMEDQEVFTSELPPVAEVKVQHKVEEVKTSFATPGRQRIDHIHARKGICLRSGFISLLPF